MNTLGNKTLFNGQKLIHISTRCYICSKVMGVIICCQWNIFLNWLKKVIIACVDKHFPWLCVHRVSPLVKTSSSFLGFPPPHWAIRGVHNTSPGNV